MELLIIGAIIVIIAVVLIGLYNGLVQKRTARRRGVRPDRGAAEAPPRSHPEPGERGQGLHGLRAEGPDRRDQARAAAVAAGAEGPAQQAAAENALTGTLRSLFAVVENYPELKANQNVLELQEALTNTENQISFSRQHYNATVLDYNTGIATFPAVLIAGIFGFVKREFFDAEPAAEAVPNVDLSLS